MYRAVFCDMDGTLLNTEHFIPPPTQQALRELTATGTPFIAVSARSPVAMYWLLEDVIPPTPIVAYGGALILDKNKETVLSLEVPRDAVVDIKDRIAAIRPDVCTTVYSFDKWITDDASDPRVVTEIGVTRIPITEAPAAEALQGGAHKVFCMGENIEEVEKEVKRLYPDLNVVRSTRIFLEITHGQAIKSNAVHRLCRAMRIAPAECVAFGDNYNDIDMLQTVGFGVAMGNAPEAVKTSAKAVTGTNNEEGVRQMLATLSFAKMDNSVRFNRGE